MKLTVNQKKLLNILLDRYEGSKTYQGTNRVAQTFTKEPKDVWPDYDSDFANVELVRDFESEMQYLQNLGLIMIQRSGGVIRKLCACNDKISDYYEILQRKPKADIIQERIHFFERWQRKNIFLINSFCAEQIERISEGKNPVYDIKTAEKLLCLLEYIHGNSVELLERELSVLVFGDSKVFEEKYRSRICKLICKYQDFSEKLAGIDDAREQEKIILEEFHVYANPSYVYLKGKLRLVFEDEREFLIGQEPVAISSEQLKKLSYVTVESGSIVTVENLTSFHRICEEDCTYLYLAGYHNSVKQALLKRIYEENPGKKWFHFGDIDPDGFYILEHLKRGTGISFSPLSMGVDELRQFEKFCKPLTKNDRVKAENLIRDGKHADVLSYMLENDRKLEQEILLIGKK